MLYGAEEVAEMFGHILKHIEQTDNLKYIPKIGFIRDTCMNCLDQADCPKVDYHSCEGWSYDNGK